MNHRKRSNKTSLIFALCSVLFVSATVANTALIKNLDILDVWTYNYNASQWIEQGNLQAGQQMYGEENVRITGLPEYLKGADWIQTAYGSKNYTPDTLAYFELKADACVYIAHSELIGKKPAWLKTYSEDKGQLTSGSGTFGIFKKQFKKGSVVSLGNNGDTRSPMYLVAVQPLQEFPPELPKGKLFDVTTFGAKGDGETINTKAIQEAIDECTAEKDGGTVYIHDGTFVSGTLELKDNVTLYVQAGSILRGSASPADYPQKKSSLLSFRTDEHFQLLFAESKKNITITGGGIIDGYSIGEGYPWKGKNNEWERPRLIRMILCENVNLNNITLIRSANWTQYYEACKKLTLLDVNVRCYTGTNNQDGIDISGCKDVLVKRFNGITGDDVICFKSMSLETSENILVDGVRSRYANCHLIKIGTETHTGIKGLTVRNVVGKARYGIAIECVDGASIEDILYENITLTGCSTPLFIRLGNRGRTFEGGPQKAPVGSMKNITIRNVRNTDIGYVEVRNGPGVGSAIGGLPDKKIENLTLENCSFLYYGSIRDKEFVYNEIPENMDKYPEFNIYGTCPAYGLYFRHIHNLICKNVTVNAKNLDVRPAIVLDDVQNADFKQVKCESFSITEPTVIWDKQ